MGDVITVDQFDIDKIRAEIPFYEKKYKGIESFNSLPYTTKHELLESQGYCPPYGDFRNPTKEVEQVYRTSGTTSKPLLLSFTKKDIDYISDIGADCFRFSGMGDNGNDEIVINCLNLSMWAGGFFDSQSMAKTGVQVINFGTGNTNELIKLIKNLDKQNKVSIHCTPSYLPVIDKRLRTEFKMEPSDLGLYSLYLGAEGGIEEKGYRENLINKWQSKVFNANYGMSEVCSIMASADNGNILRLSEKIFEYYYIELLKGNGEIANILDCKDGDEGEIVISSMFKESQPILRYRTKENICLRKRQEMQIFFNISGRTDDMIVVKGINLFPAQFRSILSNYSDLTGLYQLQIHKNKDGNIAHLNLICEIAAKDTSLSDEELRRGIKGRVRDELSISLDVNFVYGFELVGNKLSLVKVIEE